MTAGVSRGELWAERAVESVTGAEVEHVDLAGAQGEVDALIRFQDGRVHALEITSAGTEDEFEVAATIQRINWRWDAVGVWTWSIGIASMREYRRLRGIYKRVILACEARGATQPWMLPYEDLHGDADLTWAAYEARSTIHGHPERRDVPLTYVSSAAMAGAVDETLSELPADTDKMMQTQTVQRRIRKLLKRGGVDGRELFLAVAASGASFSVYYELTDPHGLPSAPLTAADGIDRVWLATGTSAIVSWSQVDGWRSHRVPERLRLEDDPTPE